MSRVAQLRADLRERVEQALDHPIVRKELLESFRSRRYLLLLSGLLLAGGVTILLTMYLFAESNDPRRVGRTTFEVFVALELALVALVFPSFSCTALVEERTNQSLDLLLTTRLTPGSVLVGKLVAALIYGFTFIFATMPLSALTFLWGGVEPGQIFLAYLAMVLLGVVVASYGLLISSLAQTPARAVVRTFMVMPFVTLVVLWPLCGAVLSYADRPPDWIPILHLREATGLNAVLIVVGILGWIGAWVSLFLRLAVNVLQPPRENRSTPLRLWLLGVWTGANLLGGVWVLNNNGALGLGQARELFAQVYGVGVVGMTLALIAFGVDEPSASPRSSRLPARLERSSLAGLLRPGGRHGVRLVLALALASWLLAGLCISIHILDDPGTTPRSLGAIWGWGGAWTLAFGLALGQAGLLLGRRLRSPLQVRWALSGALAVVTLYPLLWYGLQSSTAAGSVYKGYWLSPVTVVASVLEEPPLSDRRLRLFAPSGTEINERLRLSGEALRQLRGLRPGRPDALDAERQALGELGLPVHQASVWFYLVLWVALWQVERRRVRSTPAA